MYFDLGANQGAVSKKVYNAALFSFSTIVNFAANEYTLVSWITKPIQIGKIVKTIVHEINTDLTD